MNKAIKTALCGLIAVVAACGASGPTATTASATAKPAAKPAALRWETPAKLAKFQGRRIGKLRLYGVLSGLRQAELQGAMKLQKAGIFDYATLAQDLRTLWRMANVAGLRAEAFAVGEKMALHIHFTEAREVSSIRFQGVPDFELVVLHRVAELPKGGRLAPHRLAHATRRLHELFSGMGYIDTKIEHRLVEKTEGAELVFDIKVGKHARVRRVSIVGNKEYSSEELTKLVASSPHSNSPGKPFHKARLNNFAHDLQRFYGDRGFPFNRVGVESLSTPDGVDIIYRVFEGDKLYIKEILFTGPPTISTREYRAAFAIANGDQFKSSTISAGVTEVCKVHKNRTGNNCAATTKWLTDERRQTITLIVEITEP